MDLKPKETNRNCLCLRWYDMLYQQSTLCNHNHMPIEISNRVTKNSCDTSLFWMGRLCSYTALFNLHQGCHNSLLIYRMHLVRWCMYVTVNFFDFSEFLRLFGLLSTLFNHLWCPKNCSSIIPFYLRKLLARWHFACGCIVC